MFEAAARRFLAREGREIRRTAALPVDLLRGSRPNIRSPRSTSTVWRTTSKIQLFRMVNAPVAPPHELSGSARSLTRNLRAHPMTVQDLPGQDLQGQVLPDKVSTPDFGERTFPACIAV